MIGIPKLPTGHHILQIPIEHRPGTTTATIGELLVEVSREAFMQDSGFGPSIPGRPAWREDIAHALILEGFLDGELDNSGYVTECNYAQFDLLIQFALNALSDYVYYLVHPEDVEPEWKKEYMAIQLMFSGSTPSVVGFRSTMMTKSEAENWLKEEAPQSPNREWVIVRNSGLTT